MRADIVMTAAGLLAALTPMAGRAAPPQTYTYKTVGDLQIQADVYRPADSARLPVAVWYHGGALIMGSRGGVPKQLRDLCEAERFVLVSFDYRLAPEAKVPEIVADVKDGLKWIRESGPELFHADPSKMVVAGASAGGFLALTSGVVLDPPPTAIVSYWGFGDIDGKWTTKPDEHYRKMKLVDEKDAWSAVGDRVLTATDKSNGGGRSALFLYLKQNGLWAKVATGFDPVTEPEKLVPYCPVKNLTANYPPTLLLHGTADKDVPYEKSLDMVRELTRLKRPCELITIENGGHSLWGGDRKKIDQAFKRSMDYIRTHLRGD